MNIQPPTYLSVNQIPTQPLNVVMGKGNVMWNLRGLKGIEDQLGQINVQDGLTRDERVR